MSVALFHTCVCLFGDLRWLYFFAGGEPSEDCVRQRNPSGLCAVWKTPAGGDHKNGSVSLPLVSINLHHSPPVPPFFTSLPQSLPQSPSVSASLPQSLSLLESMSHISSSHRCLQFFLACQDLEHHHHLLNWMPDPSVEPSKCFHVLTWERYQVAEPCAHTLWPFCNHMLWIATQLFLGTDLFL